MTSFDDNQKLDALIKQGLKKSAPINFTDNVMQRIHTEKKSAIVRSGMDYSKFVLAIVLCLATLLYIQQKQLIELPKISSQFMSVATVFFSATILLIGIDKALLQRVSR